MKILDPGHIYTYEVYDDDGKFDVIISHMIKFMKREGPNYPGNEGSHSGTNCQEVLRILIDRMKYLQGQIQCDHNTKIIEHLRECIWLFEKRAAERHGISEFNFAEEDIESYPVCEICGHIICHHEKRTGEE